MAVKLASELITTYTDRTQKYLYQILGVGGTVRLVDMATLRCDGLYFVHREVSK